MKKPEISVIMSTYNEKIEYLTEAIQSVLQQTFTDFEFLIVLDNPNHQKIRCCVYEFAEQDPRIRVIPNEENLGLTRSLNRAIDVAKGTYMSRMDADDIMVFNCLEKELQVMKAENLDLVAASKINMDEQKRELGTYINDFSPKQVEKLLPYDNSINHPTVLVKLDKIRAERGYREIPSCEDYDLWIRMLGHGCRMRIIPDILLKRRMRADGVCESNAYQLYCSKHFVMDLYKRSRKCPECLSDESLYEGFMKKIDCREKKKQDFNEAYQLLYEGINGKEIGIVFRAIRMDSLVIKVLWEKIVYHIRKRFALQFV